MNNEKLAERIAVSLTEALETQGKRNMQKAETDAKGIAELLGLTVQRVYQLEKEGIISRTLSGNYNIADVIAFYTNYKRTGEALPQPEYKENEGFFLDITNGTSVTAEELGELLGMSEVMVNSFVKAGIFKIDQTAVNGIAEELQIEEITDFVNKHYSDNEEIQRKFNTYLGAVRIADSMTPSESKWELYALQEAHKAFVDAVCKVEGTGFEALVEEASK